MKLHLNCRLQNESLNTKSSDETVNKLWIQMLQNLILCIVAVNEIFHRNNLAAHFSKITAFSVQNFVLLEDKSSMHFSLNLQIKIHRLKTKKKPSNLGLINLVFMLSIFDPLGKVKRCLYTDLHCEKCWLVNILGLF